MGDREFTEFESALHKSNKILNELEEEMGWQDRRSQAYSCFREAIHAFRDMMPPQEAVNFAAQLPMLLAGLFIDGWKPSKTPIRLSGEEFYDRIQDRITYQIEGGTRHLVAAVWKVLENNMSEGQLNHVLDNLPNDLVESIRTKAYA